MKKNYRILIMFSIIAFIIAFTVRTGEKVPVEEVDVPIALGNDIKDNIFTVPICVYIFQGNKIESDVRVGKALSIGETRENRQFKSDRKFLQGGENLYLISEDYAKVGIRNMIDILFNNPKVVGTPYCAVCKGKTEDIFKFKMKGYISSVNFIKGLLENATSYNFSPDNYKLIDIFARMDSEGRNIVLPYVEIKDDKVEITGTALFKSDKMIAKISMDEAKWMNILSEDKGKGILTVQNTPNQYINVYVTAKKKIKCLRENRKYKFLINIDITADRIADEMYKDSAFFSNPDIQNKLQQQLISVVEKNCYNFITKMQNDYKVDCLELGRSAAAKYGRDTGQDWNEVVSKSDIKVNVKVHLDKLGRGGY